jgi:hypothetical protein
MQIDPSSMTSRTTIDAVLQKYPLDHASPEFRQDWDHLVNQMEPGDELWEFCPPCEADLHIWGIVLVRNGEAVETLIETVD